MVPLGGEAGEDEGGDAGAVEDVDGGEEEFTGQATGWDIGIVNRIDSATGVSSLSPTPHNSVPDTPPSEVKPSVPKPFNSFNHVSLLCTLIPLRIPPSNNSSSEQPSEIFTVTRS